MATISLFIIMKFQIEYAPSSAALRMSPTLGQEAKLSSLPPVSLGPVKHYTHAQRGGGAAFFGGFRNKTMAIRQQVPREHIR